MNEVTHSFKALGQGNTKAADELEKEDLGAAQFALKPIFIP